jgi:hypothetical protein
VAELRQSEHHLDLNYKHFLKFSDRPFKSGDEFIFRLLVKSEASSAWTGEGQESCPGRRKIVSAACLKYEKLLEKLHTKTELLILKT